MRTLTCVISYNRPGYLHNLLRSIREFCSWSDVLVLDDGSDHPQLVRDLDELARPHSGFAVIRKDRHAAGYHGGLYTLMNEALDYAGARNYELLHFVQDDMQIVWNDPKILESVRAIFNAHEDALQVQNVFHKKIAKYALIDNERFELHPESNSYHIRPYAITDTGFLNLERVHRAGFRYSETERGTSNKWRTQGFKLYGLHSPTVGFVPWPTVFQNGKQFGSWPWARPILKRSERYYLKPLSPGDVARLTSRPLEDIPFLDDYSVPVGWKCLYPFWFARPSLEYIKLIADSWKHGDRVIPRFVGRIDG